MKYGTAEGLRMQSRILRAAVNMTTLWANIDPNEQLRLENEYLRALRRG